MSADFNRGTRGNPRMDISEEQKDFILENHSRMTNEALAAAMNVSQSKLWKWVSEMGLKKKKGNCYERTLHFECNGFFVHDKRLATI